MEPEIITSSSYVQAFDDCVERINKRQTDLNKRYVVIVPDKYTLYTEQRLFEGGGAFDAEVVTFNRLLGKTGGRPKGYISRFGAVMLVRKLLTDGEGLSCFKRSVAYCGFAERIYDTIAQLKASSVTPQMLAADGEDGALKAKAADVRLIYERYLAETEGKYVDSSALLRLLPEAVGSSDYLNGAVVYILNFDRLTSLHRAALQAICRKAERVTVYEVPVKEDARLNPGKEIIVYSAESADDELRAAAARIRADVIERGARYRDFCVVTADADYQSVKRIFGEYDLPFSLDSKYSLSAHPAARLLLSALDAADGRFSRERLTELAKNALSGAEGEDAAAFENYCNLRRVDYKGFLSPFTAGDCAAAERVRRLVLDIVMPLGRQLKPRMSAAEFTAALKTTLKTASVLPLPASPYDLGGIGVKLNEAVDLMGEVMGGGVFPLPLLIKTLKEGIAACQAAYLPALSDCVAVGPPELFRGRRFKRVLAVGFNEGVLPLSVDDCGLITDGEIDRLSRLGAVIEPKTEEVNARARSELLHLLNGCDRLFLSYSSSQSAKPSSLLRLLQRQNKTTEYSRADEAEALEFAPTGELLLRSASSTGAAERLFLTSLSGLKQARRAPYLSTLALALKERARELMAEEAVKDYTLGGCSSLFFRKGTASVSQIQTFFACPYRHFLEYGLMLKERPDGKVSPKDVGVILHRLAELFTAAGDLSAPDESAEKIFGRLLSGEFKDFSDLAEGSLRRLKAEGARLCRSIAAQLNGSRYTCLGQEMTFSPRHGAPLKGPEVRLGGGRKIAVVGVVDRVDACGDKARVIDYKTGYIGGGPAEIFDVKKLYYGVKFQLPFYGLILRQNGYRLSGMFYFPISANWSDSAPYCMMTGAFDKSPGELADMDVTLPESGSSQLLNANMRKKKDGSYTVTPGALAFSQEELHCMCDYAGQVFESGVREAAEGFIAPLPYGSDGFTACDYCPYKSVCAVAVRKCFRYLGGETRAAVTGGER